MLFVPVLVLIVFLKSAVLKARSFFLRVAIIQMYWPIRFVVPHLFYCLSLLLFFKVPSLPGFLNALRQQR